MKSFSWDVLVVRGCFVLLIALSAAIMHPFGVSMVAAALIGVAFAVAGILLALRLKRVTLPCLLGGASGIFIGTALGLLLANVLSQALPRSTTAQFVRLAVPLLGAYTGLLVGMAKSDFIRPKWLDSSLPSKPVKNCLQKVLDTSVLIDGRIADIAESGFLDGKLIVPEFVLHELQLVADSSDSAKRNRGRRGLDVVQRLQKSPTVDVEISNKDFPGTREVDLKLIEFAKQSNAKVVTNDFNLNKLAQVQGVKVLNINELANFLKPIVLPGETMRVFVLKEGKEYNQGVAYLDDGTMVVVDNARRLISKTIDITVTSVLQTTAGKMIFGKYDERHLATEPRVIAAANSATG